MAGGQVVILNNRNRKARLVGIGRGLRTKVNASIRTSIRYIGVKAEVDKAKAAQRRPGRTR